MEAEDGKPWERTALDFLDPCNFLAGHQPLRRQLSESGGRGEYDTS